MRIKKVNSDAIKLHKNTEVKFKEAGNTREVQFTAGNNTFCPIQNLSKDKYLDKETGGNQRTKEIYQPLPDTKKCQKEYKQVNGFNSL